MAKYKHRWWYVCNFDILGDYEALITRSHTLRYQTSVYQHIFLLNEWLCML